jgi:5-methyltetrahydrofolate--homocysteine methyltransferase
MLLGTDIAAATAILEHLPGVAVIGLNCSTGPEHMRVPIQHLSEHCSRPVSCIPNAGLPQNVDGRAVYTLEPEPFARELAAFACDLGVNAVGGCCGTTPEHIRRLSELVRPQSAHQRLTKLPARVPRLASPLRAFDMRQEPPPFLIGERVNSQGSRRVKDLLLEEDYDGVLQVARQQAESGAHALDICVALTERTDEAAQMRQVVRRVASSLEPPVAIDSTDPMVVEAALEAYGGRAIINSINLENGRERCDAVLPLARDHGAAVVALTIDESGMARTRQRKLEVARAIRDIACDEYGLPPDALIFDALTFTLATGDAEWLDSATETIEGIRLIKDALPGVHTSLGVSNVSFGLQAAARPALNSVFLAHCVTAGLDMAIINPAHTIPMSEIPAAVRELAEDLIFNRRADALQRYIAHFTGGTEGGSPTAQRERAQEEERVLHAMTPQERIHWQILHRRRDGIEDQIDLDLRRRLGLRRDQPLPRRGGAGTPAGAAADWRARPGHTQSVHEAAVEVLNEVLLPAMKEVGDLFGAGDLILPFVLQSAEVMKRAVAHLENYLERVEGLTRGTVVLATVFGDVHDIGKNLVHTILANNGFTVHDLGKQVPLNRIIDTAVEKNADVIGLSALLVSTSKQMPLCVEELRRRGLRLPVVIGGAAINRGFGHRVLLGGDAAEPYAPGVFYCRDAFEGLDTVSALMDPEARAHITAQTLRAARESRERAAARPQRVLPGAGDTPRGVAPAPDVPVAPFLGARASTDIPLAEVLRHVDKRTLFKLSWGARGTSGEAWDQLLREEFEPRFERMCREAAGTGWLAPQAAYGYFACAADGDDLVLFEGDRQGAAELARFTFPRQPAFDRLCLSDYFLPLDAGRRDLCALQVVTAGARATEVVDELQTAGDYSESYFKHGLAVAVAEATADWVHVRIRRELGLPAGRGKRYSWGYPACPDLAQQEAVLRLLPAADIGVALTSGHQLLPEQSTAALVVHHPAAVYFSAVLPSLD